jgi:hypothetical protein
MANVPSAPLSVRRKTKIQGFDGSEGTKTNMAVSILLLREVSTDALTASGCALDDASGSIFGGCSVCMPLNGLALCQLSETTG